MLYAPQITGVATSCTGFVLVGEKLLNDEPAAHVRSLSDVERELPGLSLAHRAALGLFFANGGRDAWLAAVPESEHATALCDGLEALAALPEGTLQLLVLPDLTHQTETLFATLAPQIVDWCEKLGVFALLDLPITTTQPTVFAQSLPKSTYAALYGPYLRMSDGQTLGASAAVAGLYARIDASYGVWKTPAGSIAPLMGAQAAFSLNDLQIADWSAQRINAIRMDTNAQSLVWGGRTLAGNGDTWQYIAIRRLATYIEDSVQHSTQWVSFEPNTPALRERIRLSVDAFLLNLFRAGAFVGQKPEHAYYVSCLAVADGLSLQIGFAPTRPAEFLVLVITLKYGELR